MKKLLCALMCATATLAWADCLPIQGKITIDGKLDEPEWKKAKLETGFTQVSRKLHGPVKDQTTFAVLHDSEAVYFGITCYEAKMQDVLKITQNGLWANESVEIFLSPDGHPMSYYQFLITLHNATHAEFWDEFGVTRPDPHFGPVWQSAVVHGKDFWSVEVRIPLSSLNMTRSELWRKTWKMNIGRTKREPRIFSSWSKLSGEHGFRECKAFRSFGGFPIKEKNADFQIKSASVKINSRNGNTLNGTMDVVINSPFDGKFMVQLEGKSIRRADFRKGENTIQIPCSFTETGRKTVRLGVQRTSSGSPVERFYPVTVAYDPLKITLTTPAYRNNFYPGQKFDKIIGHVENSCMEPVQLTLTGPGLEKQVKTLPASGDFSFDTAKLAEGTAILSAAAGKEKVQLEIRRLAPSKRMMTWIENGHLVVNGKPILRRNLYATFYMGGEAFKEKYLADNLHETLEFRLASGANGRLEPNRLVKGIEAKEGVRDVKPSQKLFDAIDKAMAKWADMDFPYYYISDEPECRGVSPVYLKHIYDYVSRKDPYHVILSCSRAASTYVECADWFETHPYINPHRNAEGKRIYGREINTVGSYVDDIVKLNRPDKCIGFSPTCFSYSMGDTPTFPEFVCHTYAAMIHGGKSLFPYAYHDLGDRPALYEGVRYIFSSFEALDKFFLHGKRTRLARTEEYEAAVLEYEGQKLLVIVNFTPQAQKAVLSQDCGKFFEFRGNRTFSGKEFNLNPHEVIVGTTQKMGEKLPSYAETNALVDKLEKARLNRNNLLAPLAEEVIVTTSNSSNGIRKMFDGTLDVYAWGQPRRKKWYEISFPNTIPTFTKIRIYGKNVDGVKVSLRKRGEWLFPEAVKTNQEKYMTEYQYKEPLRTVKLHLDFSKDFVELYEIELLK